MTRSRRMAREWALRALYQVEVGHKGYEEALQEVLSVADLDEKNAAFVRDLVQGTLEYRQSRIDPLLQRFSRDWSLERLAVLDRNILRLATYELLFHPETSVAVIVNEAVELAKKYSTSESGRFVNGILGAIVDLIEQGELPREKQIPNAPSEEGSGGEQ